MPASTLAALLLAAMPPEPAAHRPLDEEPRFPREVLELEIEPGGALWVPTVVVTATREERLKEAGSVHVLDERFLGAQDYTSPDAVLAQVPGVYLRTEDGYGLRPNIGLRGANSERSSKVTLMEDGILFGPAPYAAPAAYYFPMLARITGVEVFKGPATLAFGPQTIGGALNFVSREIPIGQLALGDLSYGLHHTFKVHGGYGYGTSTWGALGEVAHHGTQGFKELDGGGDTGFQKTEVMLKARVQSEPGAEVQHRGDFKFGYAREVSNETYVGLSERDFADDPDRRYRASALDQMDYDRFAAEAGYSLGVGDDLEFTTRLYRHDFTRVWDKVNGFRSGPSIADVLADPDSAKNRVYYDVLTGAQDSSSEGEDRIVLGRNARTFVAMGSESRVRAVFETGDITHELRAGLRYHFDEVERDHSELDYAMRGGLLVRDPGDAAAALSTQNRGRVHAVALNALYTLNAWGLTLKPGARLELVHTELRDHTAASELTDFAVAPLFGLGVHYAVTPELGVLAGVHQGFSPVAPGEAAGGAEPESSINYELGLRFDRPATRTSLESIAFVSDYRNLLGQCTFSAGCEESKLDSQFNAGRVLVAGVELALEHRFRLPARLFLPVRLTYTFTHSEFLSAFDSDNPQYGEVLVGDALPYVPPHQGSLEVGLGGYGVSLDVRTTWIAPMREQAGQGDDGDLTDHQVYLDASLSYKPLPWLAAVVRGENLTGSRPVASRRPYGARPGKPLAIEGGLEFRWEY